MTTMTPGFGWFFIATVWRFSAERGWSRRVERRWATSPRAYIDDTKFESDEVIYVGPVGESKDQERR